MGNKVLEISKYSFTNGPQITMASGGVIIIDGRVLLSRGKKDLFWKFPGGTGRFEESPKDTAIREAREEAGLNIEIVHVNGKEPYVFLFHQEKDGVIKYYNLIHFLATVIGEINIKPEDGLEVAFFPVNNLPQDLAMNIMPALEYFLRV